MVAFLIAAGKSMKAMKNSRQQYLKAATVSFVLLSATVTTIISVFTLIKIGDLSVTVFDENPSDLLKEIAYDYDNHDKSSLFGHKISVTKDDYWDPEYDGAIKGSLINLSDTEIAEATIYFALYEYEDTYRPDNPVHFAIYEENEGKEDDCCYFSDYSYDVIESWRPGEIWRYEAVIGYEPADYEFATLMVSYSPEGS